MESVVSIVFSKAQRVLCVDNSPTKLQKNSQEEKSYNTQNPSFLCLRHMSEVLEDCFNVLYHPSPNFAHIKIYSIWTYCPYEQLTPTSQSGLYLVSCCNQFYSLAVIFSVFGNAHFISLQNCML